MTLPASGPISFNNINVELGVSGTTTANINQATYRTLAGVPTGTISLSNFYGKSNRVAISLTASGNNYDVYSNRGGSYVAGTSDLTVTVPGTVGSTSTGTYAMLVPSAFSPGDTVTLVNNGVIQGMGGAGGAGASVPQNGGPGSVGGNALYVNRPVTIFNNSTIAGGGGGGAGGCAGATSVPKQPVKYPGGGGGGGGAGTNGGSGGAGGFYTAPITVNAGTAGSPGTSPAGGGGGAGGPGGTGGAPPQPGGAGGGRGASGSPTRTRQGGVS